MDVLTLLQGGCLTAICIYCDNEGTIDRVHGDHKHLKKAPNTKNHPAHFSRVTIRAHSSPKPPPRKRKPKRPKTHQFRTIHEAALIDLQALAQRAMPQHPAQLLRHRDLSSWGFATPTTMTMTTTAFAAAPTDAVEIALGAEVVVVVEVVERNA